MNAMEWATRLNRLAGVLMDCWGEHIPLHVRYAAAEAADNIVAIWFDVATRDNAEESDV